MKLISFPFIRRFPSLSLICLITEKDPKLTGIITCLLLEAKSFAHSGAHLFAYLAEL